MNQLTKEELQKELEKLSPDEQLEFLKTMNNAVEEINGSMEKFIQKAE